MIIPEIHKLKTQLKYYASISNHEKTFELRKTDRDFKVRDFLHMQPFDHEKNIEFEMCRKVARITYILTDAKEFGLQDGFAILGLKFWSDFSEDEKLLFHIVDSGKINSDDMWLLLSGELPF